MKNRSLIILLLLLVNRILLAQVGINTDNSNPDPTAILDVQSTTKGMLIPKMTSALRAAIANPANGLLVYQTDSVSGVYYYNVNKWQRIGETDGSETKVTAGTNVTVSGTGTLISPYVINASGGISDHYIGELYGGGIVFWVDNTGQHGLIVSLVDISIASTWSNLTNVLIGPNAQSTWDGQGNSIAIMNQSGHIFSAAKLCDDYTNADYGTGIYSDWYLPAIDQFCLINSARYYLNKIMDGISGVDLLLDQYLWSSTEKDNMTAYRYFFPASSADPKSKSNGNGVSIGIYGTRPIRDF